MNLTPSEMRLIQAHRKFNDKMKAIIDEFFALSTNDPKCLRPVSGNKPALRLVRGGAA